MKTKNHYLLLLLMLLANSIFAQNVSTGLDAFYAPTPVGSLDAWWQITAGPNGATTARREATYSPYWQTTPMPVTNACWIDETGSIFGSTPGDYTFERTFTVSPTDGSIVADFGMAWDDVLLSAELVPPSGPAIPLTVPVGTPNQYWVGPSVNYTVTNPMPGTWTIRVVVRFIDSVGGFLLSVEVKHCPKYNISTGIDNSGAAIALGATDPNWTISSGPGGPATRRVASFPGYWQPTPVALTNACWINSTGTYNDPVGVETFDRDFTIPAGIASFTTAFGVAWDDVLVSLELVPPSGPAIPLVPPAAPAYTVSPDINYTVYSPMPGTWKVRAKVQFIDQIGGFILSGYISTKCNDDPQPCNCESLLADFGYTLDADCNGHFTGSTGSDCFSDVNYEWFVDGSSVGTGQVFDYPFTTNGVHTVCMKVTAVTPDGQVCEKIICKDVVVQCNPCNCEGLTVGMNVLVDACVGRFNAIAQGNSCMQNFTYEWSVNGIILVGTVPTMTFAFPGNGTYVVCVKVKSTLPDGTVCEKQVCQEVQVNNCTGCNCEQLNGNFLYSPYNCGLDLTAQALVPKCMSHVNYTWTINGAFAGAGPNLSVPLPGSGAYVVCLTISAVKSNGQKCEKQICKDITVNCGKSLGRAQTSPEGDKQVNLYPNPATNELNVDFSTSASGETKVTLKTIDGKEIAHETRMTDAGNQHFLLAIPSHVSAEIIIVEIENGTDHIVRKVTVSK